MNKTLLSILVLPYTLTKACVLFTPEEQKYLVEFWNQSGRYKIDQPENNETTGIWKVRLSVEASKWIYELNKKLDITFSPIDTKQTNNKNYKSWLDWVEKKRDFDRYQASCNVALLNKKQTTDLNFDLVIPPAHPGIIPEGLKALMGDAPSFVEIVAPLRYTVTFSDGKSYCYKDNTHFVDFKFSYYRFNQGVENRSLPLSKWKKEDLSLLFKDADVESSAQKVIQAISILEGGFSKLNTYDTGYVSIGFIQFACTSTGRGSLGTLLKFYKQTDPENFKKDFHDFGIEVENDFSIVIINPNTGAQLKATEAALKIIEDKRLTAVFEKAGVESRPFQIAQIKTCYEKYYPGNLNLKLIFDKKAREVPIKDFIRSEAGLATFMDRKINLGNLNSPTKIINDLILKYKINDPILLLPYEKEIVQKLRYRKDFLKDSSLTQPEVIKENPESYVKVVEEIDQKGKPSEACTL